MNRFLALTLALVLSLSLAACGGGRGGEATPEGPGGNRGGTAPGNQGVRSPADEGQNEPGDQDTANPDKLPDAEPLPEVIIAKEGWPSFSEYPVDIPPPDDYTVIDAYVFYEDDSEYDWYGFNFTCVDMDEVAAQQYLDSLNLDSYVWNGKTYYIQCDQIYQNGANIDFSFGINPVEFYQ